MMQLVQYVLHQNLVSFMKGCMCAEIKLHIYCTQVDIQLIMRFQNPAGRTRLFNQLKTGNPNSVNFISNF